MVGFYALAEATADSEWGQAYGLKKMPSDDLVASLKIAAEFAVRLTHWVPGVSIVTGMLTLTHLGYKISQKNHPGDEDIGEFVRALLAITCCTFVLIALDVTVTYIRYQPKESPHDKFDYLGNRGFA